MAMSCDAMRMIQRDKQMWNPLMEEVFNSFPERFFVQTKGYFVGNVRSSRDQRFPQVFCQSREETERPVNNVFTSTELS